MAHPKLGCAFSFAHSRGLALSTKFTILSFLFFEGRRKTMPESQQGDNETTTQDNPQQEQEDNKKEPRSEDRKKKIPFGIDPGIATLYG
jgi:hypothetical protein